MPKMKTRKSMAKRIQTTASGRLRVRHAFASHNLTRKSAKRKRRLRSTPGTLSTRERQKVVRMLAGQAP
jgi:large subunit ribosomal protein L35